MRKSVLLLTCILFTSSPCLGMEPGARPEPWATPIVSESLNNWHKVDNLVYRSEQPDAEAMAEIEKFGIKRVLNLRVFHDDDDETVDLDLKTFHVPINTTKIENSDVVQSLKIIKSSSDPILIHCWHGADRTGVIVAMYRIVEQGWTKEEAIDELKNGGYNYHSIFGNIIKYIESANIDSIRSELGSGQ